MYSIIIIVLCVLIISYTEDYQLTAAFNVLKIVACENNPSLSSHYGSVSVVDGRPRVIISSSNESIKSSSTSETLITSSSSASVSAPTTPRDKKPQDDERNCMSSSSRKRQPPVVPEELLLLSIRETDSFLSRLDHEDIEESKTQLVCACSPLFNSFSFFSFNLFLSLSTLLSPFS